jgi:hypothetical protein
MIRNVGESQSLRWFHLIMSKHPQVRILLHALGPPGNFVPLPTIVAATTPPCQLRRAQSRDEATARVTQVPLLLMRIV